MMTTTTAVEAGPECWGSFDPFSSTRAPAMSTHKKSRHLLGREVLKNKNSLTRVQHLAIRPHLLH